MTVACNDGPFAKACLCCRCHDTFLAVGKDELAKLHEDGRVQQFKHHRFPAGHGATNYGKWLRSARSYSVSAQEQYEPWFISHWDAMPW